MCVDPSRRARELEGSLLGGLLLMPHLHAGTRVLLADGDFFCFRAHRTVFVKIGELGSAANLHSIGTALGTEELESIGGVAGLSAYEDRALAATKEWVMWFARQVGEQGRRRRLAAAAGELQHKILNGEDICPSWDELCGVCSSLVLPSEECSRQAAG